MSPAAIASSSSSESSQFVKSSFVGSVILLLLCWCCDPGGTRTRHLRSLEWVIELAATPVVGENGAAREVTSDNRASTEGDLENIHGDGFQPVRPAGSNRLKFFDGKLAIRRLVIRRKCHPVSPVWKVRDDPRSRGHDVVRVRWMP